MENLSSEELAKIKEVLNSCEDMIHGKFILADVKIMKLLNLIANSEPLYRYIQECLLDFNFEREYNRAEVKNRFNNGHFTPPTTESTLVAMVFSLLVEFDKKRMDFYSFITTNFRTLTKGLEYETFAQTLLVPFKNIIEKRFFGTEIQPNFEQEKVEEIKRELTSEEENNEVHEEVKEDKLSKEETIWKNILVIVENAQNQLLLERKIKGEQRENIEYLLNSLKYCCKYKDIRIVSSMYIALQVLIIKSASLKFILGELKNEISKYFELASASKNND